MNRIGQLLHPVSALGVAIRGLHQSVQYLELAHAEAVLTVQLTLKCAGNRGMPGEQIPPGAD